MPLLLKFDITIKLQKEVCDMADNEKYAYRLDSAPLLPPPQGEGDREAVEGVYLQWKDTPPVSCR